MAQKYRITFQSYNDKNPKLVIKETVLLEDEVKLPSDCFDISMGYSKQLTLIQGSQDCVLEQTATLINQEKKDCPNCQKRLHKFGSQKSTLHDVLTDHKVTIKRLKCRSCGYEEPSTIRKLIGTVQTGDLKRVQTKLGSNMPYRESRETLELFSNADREINNHDRIKKVTESVGKVIGEMNKVEKEIAVAEEAETIILNVDGGHINTTEPEKRSMEAMTTVIYRPESLVPNDLDTRRYLTSKSCAASVKKDNQEEIISGTLIAALKQGLTENTHVVALCDGASNCWNVVESLRSLCGKMTCILDWFHLAMKIQNISLPEKQKNKLIRVKWHLWRGNIDNALVRLNQLIESSKNETHILRLKKLLTYISNNRKKIINYRDRQKSGLVFTSNLAESTVESLINQRCKGQQHMRWSREGLNPILQLRAAINSKSSGGIDWRTAILNAA